jgi:hypothetical protein
VKVSSYQLAVASWVSVAVGFQLQLSCSSVQFPSCGVQKAVHRAGVAENVFRHRSENDVVQLSAIFATIIRNMRCRLAKEAEERKKEKAKRKGGPKPPAET